MTFEWVSTALVGAVALDVDVASIGVGTAARADFEAAFILDLSALLQIETERIRTVGITAGSAIVGFSVSPAADGTALGVEELEQAFSSGQVRLAGASADGLAAPQSAASPMI